jgi:hypothetical protein
MAQSTNPRRESPGFEESSFPSRKYDEDMDIKQILIRNETLLWDLRAQRDTETSRQLELLQAIRDELVSQTTPLHLICNAVLQWLLVATGIIFGMFAIAGTGLQKNGNFLAKMQNQMNLVTFCQSNNSVGIASHRAKEQNVNTALEYLRPPLRGDFAERAFHNCVVGRSNFPKELIGCRLALERR